MTEHDRSCLFDTIKEKKLTVVVDQRFVIDAGRFAAGIPRQRQSDTLFMRAIYATRF